MANDAAQPKLESIQDHAKTLTAELIKDGKLPNVQDADAATAAAMVPIFSSGTRAIDPNTGEQIIEKPDQPEFSTTAVAMPKDGETPGAAQAQEDARERDAQGRFVGESVTPPKEDAPLADQTPAQAAGTQAAEAVATQLAEEMDDYEFEDPDFEGIKIPLKYPKKFAGIIKRAIPRQSDYHRMRNRWGDAAATLEPLLNDGRFARVLPMIQRAMVDDVYGNFVMQAFQRAQQGLPLQDVPREAQQPVRQPQNPAAPEEPGFVDPLLDQALDPYRRQLAEMQQWRQTTEQQQQEAARQAQAQRQQQEAAGLQAQAAHRDLESMFPGQFKTSLGPNDPAWQRASKYAGESGYVEAYGLRAGVIFAAQQLNTIDAERLAATSSPAAAALNAVDQRQVELARQQAAQVARAAGGGAPRQTAAPVPKPKPTTMKDGKIKSPAEFMAEVAGYVQQTA